MNKLNNHSFGPLYLAILNDQRECIEHLLEEGAMTFIDGTDQEKDRSPVFLTIRQQKTQILEIIFDYDG